MLILCVCGNENVLKWNNKYKKERSKKYAKSRKSRKKFKNA